MFSPGGIREVDYDRLDVWANEGLTDNFSRIPGVMKVSTQNIEVSYMIFVDPRYNLKWVMAEIEAVAKTEKPIKKRAKKTNGGYLFVDWASGSPPKPEPKKRKVAKRATKKRGAND